MGLLTCQRSATVCVWKASYVSQIAGHMPKAEGSMPSQHQSYNGSEQQDKPAPPGRTVMLVADYPGSQDESTENDEGGLIGGGDFVEGVL